MMTGNGVMHNGTTVLDEYGHNLDRLKVGPCNVAAQGVTTCDTVGGGAPWGGGRWGGDIVGW